MKIASLTTKVASLETTIREFKEHFEIRNGCEEIEKLILKEALHGHNSFTTLHTLLDDSNLAPPSGEKLSKKQKKLIKGINKANALLEEAGASLVWVEDIDEIRKFLKVCTDDTHYF